MDMQLSPVEKTYLLALARRTIERALQRQAVHIPVQEILPYPADLVSQVSAGASALKTPSGAFVTLEKGKALRGCIGRMVAVRPLEETVRDMALEAAFEDPRFPPLSEEELPRCSIEISVLSPLERCDNPKDVVVGRHGLYLIHRGRAGVLLPQVPVEQGWNREEFLDYLCRKAGLPPGSYQEPGAELYTFTATVFSEV